MKTKTVAFVIGVFLLFVSCASGPEGIHNPENIQEEDLITLNVDHALNIERIDDTVVDWHSSRDYIIKLPSGVHTLYTRYQSGGLYTSQPAPVKAQFEQGNTYLLTHIRSTEYSAFSQFQLVSYHIYLYNDKKEGEEVTLKAGLFGNWNFKDMK